MATATLTKPAAKGGSFLLESPQPSDIFTPADLTDDTPLHLNLKDGPHTVTLRLVDDDGQPLNPDVVVSLHLTVQALVGRVTPFDATPYLALANILLGLGILAALYRKLEAGR